MALANNSRVVNNCFLSAFKRQVFFREVAKYVLNFFNVVYWYEVRMFILPELALI